jgi:hypothetical protein
MENPTSTTGLCAGLDAFVTNLCQSISGDGRRTQRRRHVGQRRVCTIPRRGEIGDSRGDGYGSSDTKRLAFRHSSTDAETFRRLNTPARSDPVGPRADLLRTMKWVSRARPVLAIPF